jgi:tetratricopeptide (TPR) repeat protein
VLLAAAAFRAVYFHQSAARSPFFATPILDSEVYDAWAARIAGGAWLDREPFYFPPLYPYLLGILYRLFGRSLPLVYALQMALGLVNIALLHRIGARLFSARAGLIAAAAAALYAPFAFFETKILTTTLGLTLHLAALLLLARAEDADAAAPPHRRRAAPWLAAGAAIGATALCAPGAILLAAAYAAILVRRRPRAALGVAAGAFAALLPVLAHNLAVAGDPLILSGQGGITFYQGNNAGANGLYAPVAGFSGAPERQAAEEKAIAERAAGRPLPMSRVSLHFFARGLDFIVRQPARWLLLEARKIGHLLGNYEASTEYSLYHERAAIPWLRLPALPWAALAGAGLAGLLQAARRPRGEAPSAARALLAATACAAAVPLLFYVSSRYRLPLAAGLVLYGAGFVDRALRDRAALARRPGPLLAGAALALLSIVPLGRPNVMAEANVDYNVGNVFADRGEHERAIAAFDRSLAAWPGNAYAHINRGNSLDRLGREDEALASYRRAEQANPRFWTAYRAQGTILRRQRRHEEEAEAYRRGLAAGGAEARYLLGATLKRLGRIDEAEAHLLEAIRLEPRYAHAHARLGEIHAGRGETDRAIASFRQALAADPANAAARAGLERLGVPAAP